MNEAWLNFFLNMADIRKQLLDFLEHDGMRQWIGFENCASLWYANYFIQCCLNGDFSDGH